MALALMGIRTVRSGSALRVTVTLSALTFQGTVLAKPRVGDADKMRWMTVKVA